MELEKMLENFTECHGTVLSQNGRLQVVQVASSENNCFIVPCYLDSQGTRHYYYTGKGLLAYNRSGKSGLYELRKAKKFLHIA